MTIADDLIARLGLEPHPEGGHFRETWRHVGEGGSRGAGTAIYFLLRAGEESHWHRIDASEIWHHYAGAPLDLWMHRDGRLEHHRLGDDLLAGDEPQVLVPPGTWQRARSTGDFTLVGCTCAPAFVFHLFELAPPGWEPG